MANPQGYLTNKDNEKLYFNSDTIIHNNTKLSDIIDKSNQFAIATPKDYIMNKSGSYGGVIIPFNNFIINGDLFTNNNDGSITCNRRALVQVSYSFAARRDAMYVLHYLTGSYYMGDMYSVWANSSLDTTLYAYNQTIIVEVPAGTKMHIDLGDSSSFTNLSVIKANIVYKCIMEL